MAQDKPTRKELANMLMMIRSCVTCGHGHCHECPDWLGPEREAGILTLTSQFLSQNGWKGKVLDILWS